ncbi:MAG TPA: Rieske (2Fe-2S) protein [Bacteroidales bacterium]
MERRNFLKTTGSVCAMVSIAMVTGSLTSCSQLPIYKTAILENKVAVPLNLFQQTSLQIIKPAGYDYNIALQKENDGTFTALLLRCTHSDNQLSSTGNGFVCNLHGSRFDKEGIVLKGPAERPLKRLRTSLSSDNVTIYLS